MKNIAVAVVFAVAAAVACRADTKTVWRDTMGRVTGTKTVK